MAQLDIETIAKAIHDANAPHVEWDKESSYVQKSYKVGAVAAVRAMREPSDSMLTGAHTNALGGSEAVPIWHAMIDHLLKSA
jgi:hypothetical protein